jgi:hypothetical protein
MRIGFVTIYSFRPHAEFMHYLAGLARDGGHTPFYLTCDSDLPSCYSRDLRPRIPSWIHCAACRSGSLRSYVADNITSIGKLNPNLHDAPTNGMQWSASSAATLGRFETDAELASDEFVRMSARLDPAARIAFSATRHWIDENRLDAICLFNGRMEATRGVLEAARAARIPFVTTERTWFGDGLHLTPNDNCLGLSASDAVIAAWRDVPLTRTQAFRAARHIASRFLRTNTKEWRAYNTKARTLKWPLEGGRYRVLLTPGSRTESWGHPELGIDWPERTAAFDAVIDHLGLKPADLILRCHPVWGQTIGISNGWRSERYYADWARRRGIHIVPSADPTSTLGLIEQADAILVCGGSAALEAGILGKQVIGVAPSTYQQAGFQSRAYSATELPDLRLNVDMTHAEQNVECQRIRQLTLRYCHSIVYRASQFVPYVRAKSTTQYEYLEGADPERLTRLLNTGMLEADDGDSSADSGAEIEVLRAIEMGRWSDLLTYHPEPLAAAIRSVRRRMIYRPIDRLREVLPRGDL